jgi:hypothetical protein
MSDAALSALITLGSSLLQPIRFESVTLASAFFVASFCLYRQKIVARPIVKENQFQALPLPMTRLFRAYRTKPPWCLRELLPQYSRQLLLLSDLVEAHYQMQQRPISCSAFRGKS